MALFIRCSYVNHDRNVMFAQDPEPQRAFTDSRKELFLSRQREYGRCTSKIYEEGPDGNVPVGWVFLGRDKYSDTGETYLRETWVEVIEQD